MTPFRGRSRAFRSTAVALLAALGVSLAPAPATARDADPWTGPDKALHLAAGTLLSGASYALWAERRDGRHWGALLGVGVGLTAGGVKELLDLGGLGHPSAKDFAWTALGAVLGTGLALLIDFAARGARPPSRHPADPVFP